jgi:hypothetical protein
MIFLIFPFPIAGFTGVSHHSHQKLHPSFWRAFNFLSPQTFCMDFILHLTLVHSLIHFLSSRMKEMFKKRLCAVNLSFIDYWPGDGNANCLMSHWKTVFYKSEHIFTIWSSNHALICLPKWTENLLAKQNQYACVYSKFINIYQNMEASKIPVSQWMEK